MKIPRSVMIVGSFALGALLVWFLIRLGRIDVASTIRELAHVSLGNMLKLLFLSALLVLLSTMKWRTTDAALRHASDGVPSKMAAYMISSLGMALGLVLPVQLGMTAARTAGTYAYGRTLKRGTGGTVFEQSFDLLVTLLLSLASLMTYAIKGSAWTWSICAVVVVASSLLSAKWLLRVIEKLLSKRSEQAVRNAISRILPAQPKFVDRFLQNIYAARESALMDSWLVRRLVLLSAFRFVVVVLIAKQTAEMTGAAIGLWTMTFAVPFAAISNFIALTPGGVGVNELASVAALHAFGTPLNVASQWAIANRVLMMAAYFAVAIVALTVAAITHSPLRAIGEQSARKPEGI